MSVFKYNPNASYDVKRRYNSSKITNLISLQIALSDSKAFTELFPDVFAKYVIGITSEDVKKRWGSYSDSETGGYWQRKLTLAWNEQPMGFYQNQINFCTWIASTGCGVSFNDHLTGGTYLQRKILKFHVYYTIRRLMKEMSIPIVGDRSFDQYQNGIDMRAYERICNEFGVSTQSNWKTNGSFGIENTHMDHEFLIADNYSQHTMANITYKKFMLDNSIGFTRPGVIRINESIRTYVYCLLSAQGLLRNSIMNPETQKEFLSLFEDSVNSPVNLPSSMERYQSVLKYARTEVNFVVGYGLQMCPSNMELKIGNFTGYNNLLLIATPNLKLGTNRNINQKPPEPDT